MAVWSCFFMHRSVQRKYAAVNICSDIDKKTMVTLKGCAMVFLCTRASRGKCQHALTDARRAGRGNMALLCLIAHGHFARSFHGHCLLYKV